MIICGNIYLDEINKTFLLKCVLCEKKSKAYSEFTKHIKKKHKTLDEAQKEEIAIKEECSEAESEAEDQKPLIFLQNKHNTEIKHEQVTEIEMEVLEDDDIKYNVAVEEPIADPILALEEKCVDIPEVTDDLKDEDFVPQELDQDNYSDDDDNYSDDVDGGSDSSDNEVIPMVTDKFNPTFFRKKRFLDDFIELYKSQPVLWNISHEDFENPASRKEAERNIIRGMQKFNVFLKPNALNGALNRVQKYCAIIKHNLESPGQKKLPEVTLGYYKKCDFLKDLLIKNNISGIQDSSKPAKLLQFKEWDEKTSAFVDIFETLPILYDGEHPSYGDVDGRQRALDEFSNILKSQHNIEFSEEIIANAIEQLQSWYYKTKQRKEKQNSKLNKDEEKYYRKCKSFMPAERLRYRFVCSVCKKNFHLRHNLQCHLFKIHSIGELPFACDQCERKFESKFALHGHIQRIHVGKTYPCKFCDKKFAVPSELRIHSSIHSTEKPHTCELCGKSFRLKVQLGYHVTAIHTKIRAFKCTMCPKDFLKKRDLTDHIKSHLNIRDKICETCGKGFSNCHSLIRHRQIHSEVKKFACKLCDAKFHQFVGLNGHMKRTHNIVKKPV